MKKYEMLDNKTEMLEYLQNERKKLQEEILELDMYIRHVSHFWSDNDERLQEVSERGAK